MDPSGLPAMFRGLEVKAGDAAAPAVSAMADTFQTAVKRTLALRQRGSHDFRPKGERGQPPARRSGALRNSVTRTGGVGYVVAAAEVTPMIFYAAVQEWGHEMHSRPGGYMRFWSGGNRYDLKTVTVGANPYMRPTVKRCIANGSLSRSAAKAFSAAMWGRP